MRIKEVLSDQIIRERLLLAMGKIKEEGKRNFAGPLNIISSDFRNGQRLYLYTEEKKKRSLMGFSYKVKEKILLAWIDIMQEKIVCGVREPVLFSIAKDRITKIFESFHGETLIKELIFKKDFEVSPDEIAAK